MNNIKLKNWPSVALFISISFFFLAWGPIGLFPLMFIALIPLILIAKNHQISFKRTILLIWITFITLNVSISFWVVNLSIAGAVVYWLVSSVLQTLPFFFIANRKINSWAANISFIASWILLEGFQLHTDFSFPLFILGNSLSSIPSLIQWYQITGVLGGTLWILVINLLVAEGIHRRNYKKIVLSVFVVLILPISVSLFSKQTKPYKKLDVLIAHTNVNCYTEKFTRSSEELVDQYLDITKTAINASTDLVLWPETAITSFGWIENIPTNNPTLNNLIGELKEFSNTTLITGGTLYKEAPLNAPTSIYSDELGLSLYTYNSAIGLDFKNQQVSIRHKEKLVPVEEYQPYPWLATYLSFFYKSLSGIKFNKHVVKNNLFTVSGSKILPLICFEILYGDFINKTGKNANGIVLIMNEGWYDNLWASRQFLEITKIRAIEQQKNIAISSNRGHSGFVHPDGSFEITNEYKAKSISGHLGLNKTRTFYSQFGDFLIDIAAIALTLSIIMSIKKVYFKPSKG